MPVWVIGGMLMLIGLWEAFINGRFRGVIFAVTGIMLVFGIAVGIWSGWRLWFMNGGTISLTSSCTA